jgi:hypothetical protein
MDIVPCGQSTMYKCIVSIGCRCNERQEQHKSAQQHPNASGVEELLSQSKVMRF